MSDSSLQRVAALMGFQSGVMGGLCNAADKYDGRCTGEHVVSIAQRLLKAEDEAKALRDTLAFYARSLDADDGGDAVQGWEDDGYGKRARETFEKLGLSYGKTEDLQGDSQGSPAPETAGT